MYEFGALLKDNRHFYDHMNAGIPVEIYHQDVPVDIGLVTGIHESFIEIGQALYHRGRYVFLSRPGY
ncbi:hypothetical protein [Saccharibacillus sp. JS10]|uniref:hypothetical protein n=1 Tax=Saccharibacillus sp. JS10 TaxID=2950552 RepID=UPI00210B89DA|nr:hypothetical protein [Saccharibacillus sp. JS10]MCQ4088956.1 hypothetical protein [Saccharibacillus sp. JS10]